MGLAQLAELADVCLLGEKRLAAAEGVAHLARVGRTELAQLDARVVGGELLRANLHVCEPVPLQAPLARAVEKHATAGEAAVELRLEAEEVVLLLAQHLDALRQLELPHRLGELGVRVMPDHDAAPLAHGLEELGELLGYVCKLHQSTSLALSPVSLSCSSSASRRMSPMPEPSPLRESSLALASSSLACAARFSERWKKP